MKWFLNLITGKSRRTMGTPLSISLGLFAAARHAETSFNLLVSIKKFSECRWLMYFDNPVWTSPINVESLFVESGSAIELLLVFSVSFLGSAEFELLPQEDNDETYLDIIDDWNVDVKLSNEFETLGFFISDHPLNQYKSLFNQYNIIDYEEFNSNENILSSNISSTILKVQEKKTQKGNSYAILKLTDLSLSLIHIWRCRRRG